MSLKITSITDEEEPQIYTIGRAIITPRVRFTIATDKSIHKMFHSVTYPNTENIKVKRTFEVVNRFLIEKYKKKKNYRVTFAYSKFFNRYGGAYLDVYKVTKTWIPHYITPDCDTMDAWGWCPGHQMSRKEFIERYCQGVDFQG